MVPYVLSLRHLDLIACYFLLLFLDDIITLKLKPFFITNVEDNFVTIMKGTDIKSPVSGVHDSIINFELAFKSSIFSIIVELDGLDEVLLLIRVIRIICIFLISLDNGHISLLCLDDIHRKVFQVVSIVLCL